MDDDEIKDQLRRRFDFTDWPQPSEERVARSTERFAAVGALLGGWRAQRVAEVPVPRATAASRSVWGREERSDTLISVELIEAESSGQAREILLDLLNEFESPQVERQSQAVAGDVAFTVPGDTVALFAHANVVALVRNAGREVVSVADFARQLDRSLTARP